MVYTAMKINYSHTRFNKNKFQKHKRSHQRNTDSHQVCMCALAQLCPTLCDPMDVAVRLFCSWDSPDRILEWISILFTRGSPWPRDRTQVSYTAGGFFSIWATREAPSLETNNANLLVNLLRSNRMVLFPGQEERILIGKKHKGWFWGAGNVLFLP